MPKDFIGAGHLGTLCPGHIKTRDSQKESGFGINHIVCANSLGKGSYSSQFWEWWEAPEIQVPGGQPRVDFVSQSFLV